MKLSGELDYRIRYDVEHDLFHAQNIFNDEYIKPTFIEYVQKLEQENAELEAEVKEWKDKADLWCKTANLKDHNIMINKELEQENAELKHTIATLRQEKDNVSMHAKAMEVVAKTKSDQLTKAKKIIKDLCGMVRELNKPNVQLTNVDYSLSEAEQFLNSEVEK